jgi:hypothetical protein
MVIGSLLIILVLFVMISLGMKANGSVAVSRQAGNTSGSDLSAFGYKQELLRDMGGFSIFPSRFQLSRS